MTGKGLLSVLAIALGVAIAPPARAGQSADGKLSIETSLDREQVAVGEEATLTITIRSATLALPDISLPAIPGVNAQRAGTQQTFSMTNGRVERGLTVVYRLAPNQTGPVHIPALRVTAGDQTAASDPLTLQVGRAGSFAPLSRGPAGAPPLTRGSPEIFVKAAVSRPRVYWNQQTVLWIRLYARVDVLGDIDWRPASIAGFWSESLGPPRQSRVRMNGAEYAVMEIPTALFPTRTGTLKIGTAQVRCRIARVVQQPDPWSMLGMPEVEPQDVVLATDPIYVTVDPLPPGAPPAFSGAVGRFDLSLKVDRLSARSGEPVTAHAVIRGEGNVATIRDPEIRAIGSSRHYLAGSGTRVDRTGGTIQGEKTTDLAFVPDQPGTLVIEPVRFTWFDPEAGKYRTQSSDSVRVRVVPGSAAETSGSAAAKGEAPLASPRREHGPVGRVALGPSAQSSALLGISFLAYAGAIVAGRLRDRRTRDPRAVRRLRIRSLLDGSLARAETLATSGRAAHAAAVAEDALRAGVAVRFDAELAGLSRSEALEAIRTRGASPEETERIAALLGALERIAYAPPETRRADARESIGGVRSLLERYAGELA